MATDKILRMPGRCRQWLATHLELPDSPNRILPMEGLRGFAVLLVFMVHQHALFGKYLVPGTPLQTLSAFAHGVGNAGVDLFFVLSGYLIYGALIHKPVSFFTFMRRRIQRIYPAFTAVFLGYVIVCWLFRLKIPSSPVAAGIYIAENYLLLPGMVAIVPLVAVAWSLSYEFFFYLFIPLLVGLTEMRRWSRTARVVFFGTLFAVHMVLHFLAGAAVERHDLRLRLSMFIAGILLYELLQSGVVINDRLTRITEWPVIGIICLSLPLVARIGDQPKACKWLPGFPASVDLFWTGILFVTMSALVLYAFVARGLLQRLFTWAPLRWLGNMSYSYYLLHGAVLQGFALLAGVALGPRHSVFLFMTTLVCGLILTLGAAFVLFIFVEKPYSLQAKPKPASPGGDSALAAPKPIA